MTLGNTGAPALGGQPPADSARLPLVAAVGLLLGLGLVLVYSASSVHAAQTYGDAEHFFVRQGRCAALGLLILAGASWFPGEILQRRAGWVLLACVALSVGVLLPGVGHLVSGARRWIVVGGFGFQPSEIAKLAVVIVLAAMLAKRERDDTSVRSGLLLPVVLTQVPVFLTLAEPDLGTALVIELIVVGMVFAAGLRLRTLMVLVLAVLPVFYHLVLATPFRVRRLLGYIDPWAYRSSVGYQITEALISIGSGGLTGVGLGEGKHKLFFLPEAHTDFIFAILAEELGFVGVVAFVLAWMVVLFCGGRIALRGRTPFDRYLALGLTILLGVPTLFNMGVATGLLPTKGLPLPLLSSGGSNLVMTLTAVGLLLRIERDARMPTAIEVGA